MLAEQKVREGTDERCHTEICCDRGCSLSMENAPETFVLLGLERDGTPVHPDEPRCDFLFVGGGRDNSFEWVAPIELTKSPPRTSKFLPQLRTGASVAERLIPRDAKVRFRPIAVHGRELHRAERVKFLDPCNHIEFHRRKFPITLAECCSHLADVLSD